jgi:hypothetical protein
MFTSVPVPNYSFHILATTDSIYASIWLLPHSRPMFTYVPVPNYYFHILATTDSIYASIWLLPHSRPMFTYVPVPNYSSNISASTDICVSIRPLFGTRPLFIRFVLAARHCHYFRVLCKNRSNIATTYNLHAGTQFTICESAITSSIFVPE